MQYLRALCPKLPRPPVFVNATAYLHSQVAVLRQLLSMFLANVAISRTADINKKISVCLLISETDVWTVGFDLHGSGDGGIPHIVMSSVSTSLSVPSALHCNPKMATNIPVNDGGHLIVDQCSPSVPKHYSLP